MKKTAGCSLIVVSISAIDEYAVVVTFSGDKAIYPRNKNTTYKKILFEKYTIRLYEKVYEKFWNSQNT